MYLVHWFNESSAGCDMGSFINSENVELELKTTFLSTSAPHHIQFKSRKRTLNILIFSYGKEWQTCKRPPIVKKLVPNDQMCVVQGKCIRCWRRARNQSKNSRTTTSQNAVKWHVKLKILTHSWIHTQKPIKTLQHYTCRFLWHF